MTLRRDDNAVTRMNIHSANLRLSAGARTTRPDPDSDRTLAHDSDETVRGVSRKAAIADDGVVFTEELGRDLLSNDAAVLQRPSLTSTGVAS